jgi:hypothetical protein
MSIRQATGAPERYRAPEACRRQANCAHAFRPFGWKQAQKLPLITADFCLTPRVLPLTLLALESTQARSCFAEGEKPCEPWHLLRLALRRFSE